MTSSSKKVVENKELVNIASALGCGVGDALRLDKLRYGKVIILTDADADGMHIATLLMAFFFQHMRPLIDAGHLFLGKSPLYGIFPKGGKVVADKAEPTTKGKKGKGRKSGAISQPGVFWAYSDLELAELIKEHRLSSPRIVRYKGLGEMNPSTLWETTLDPRLRTVLRVSAHDSQAVGLALEELMGSDPSKRYELIQSHASDLEVDV